MREILKYFKDRDLAGFLTASNQGMKNKHYFVIVFVDRGSAEAYVNSVT